MTKEESSLRNRALFLKKIATAIFTIYSLYASQFEPGALDSTVGRPFKMFLKGGKKKD